MPVTVNVTSVIQQAVNGQREFKADGGTIRELKSEHSMAKLRTYASVDFDLH